MSANSGVRKLREAVRVILVGAPGVGKGTQSERLMRRYPQLASISTGDLLRDNVRDQTPLGRSEAVALDEVEANLLRDPSKVFHEFWSSGARSIDSQPHTRRAHDEKVVDHPQIAAKDNISNSGRTSGFRSRGLTVL